MEVCDMCGIKTDDVFCGGGKSICKKCFEQMVLYDAAEEGVKQWLTWSIRNYTAYDRNVDTIIWKYIVEEKRTDMSTFEQLEAILAHLYKEIELRVSFYCKEELFSGLLAIKEYIRRYLLRSSKPEWKYINDISAVGVLMKIANGCQEFEDNSLYVLENNCSNLVNAICLARRYDLIKNNISILNSKINDEINDIEKLCCEPIRSCVLEEYFEVYLRNGKAEKLEDYKIKDDILRGWLEDEGKTPEKILESLDSLLLSEIGFSTNKIDMLSRSLFQAEFSEEKFMRWTKGEEHMFEHFPIFVMEKKMLTDLVGEECFEAILNVFSLNRNADKDTRILELFCFYEVDDFLVFGNMDLVQSFSIFEKLLLSGHYIEVSQYFSYCVADILYSNGYCLPMQKYKGKNRIRAEIERIDIETGNLLVDASKGKIGDIDVLALNREKKEIILLELKYYKPSMEYKEILYRDKSLILDKRVINHIKEREEAVSKNSGEVVKFVLGTEEQGYSVKSILHTARTNLYGIQEKEVEYMTWDDFLTKAKNKEL